MGAFYITFVINFLIFVKFIRPCQTGIGFFFFFFLFLQKLIAHASKPKINKQASVWKSQRSKSKYQESKQLSTQKNL